LKRSQDYFSKLARKKHFAARSVFKLQEMQDRFHLFKPGDRVLDIGSAPGSWSQFCLERLGGNGFVVAVDLQDPRFDASRRGGYRFIRGDIFDAEVQTAIRNLGPYDLVMSDAAPNTSGSGLVDAQISFEIAGKVLEIASSSLKAHGNTVVKIFQGGDEGKLLGYMKKHFRRAKAFKPGASRSESREIYFIGFDHVKS
jgi:23S rRNA (uridine2552-2'-O)-methyltransferase